MDSRLRMLLCMGTSDHTRDPPPGASELEKLSRQTFRCVGGTPILIGLSSQIGRLAALPPHPHAMNRMQVGTKCTHEKHGSIFRHRMRWMQRGSQRGHKMRSPHPHKMRGHGRERLGLKACSPRMRAVTGEGQETSTKLPTAWCHRFQRPAHTPAHTRKGELYQCVN